MWTFTSPAVTKWSTPQNGVQSHSKPRINCEYSILYLQLFRDFEWVCTPFRGVLHFVTAGSLHSRNIYTYIYVFIIIYSSFLWEKDWHINKIKKNVYVYVYTLKMYIGIYVHTYVCIYIYIYIHPYIRTYVYIYIDIYVYMYIFGDEKRYKPAFMSRKNDIYIAYRYLCI
jgi:hypothetical protein